MEVLAEEQEWTLGLPDQATLGLEGHQQMSSASEEKMAFTATLAGSYEDAAQLSGRWGCPVADSVIHRVVERIGPGQGAPAPTDEGKWIWNVVRDRWPHARQLLDFYNASEHLRELGASKGTTSPHWPGGRTIGRSRPRTRPSGAGPSNQPAAKASAASNAPTSSGPNAGLATSTPLTKPAVTDTGMNSPPPPWLVAVSKCASRWLLTRVLHPNASKRSVIPNHANLR